MSEYLSTIGEEMMRLSRNLDESIDELYKRSEIWAKEEAAYKKRWAETYIGIEEGTVKERESRCDLACNESWLTSHLAEALMKTCTESVRAKRTQVQALMTYLSAAKAEMEMAR